MKETTATECSSSPLSLRFFDRLALKAGVDATALKVQCERLKPIATTLAAAGGLSTLDAWAAAIARVQSRRALQAAYPVGDLLKVLQDYAVFSASSSGVEQSFTKSQWAFSDRQGSASLAVEQNTLKLILDYHAHEEKAVCTGAQQVFARVFGKSRTGSRVARMDVGCPQPKSKGTEIAFLRDRRAAVPKAIPAAVQPGEGFDLACSWGPEHEKEMLFTAKKDMTESGRPAPKTCFWTTREQQSWQGKLSVSKRGSSRLSGNANGLADDIS